MTGPIRIMPGVAWAHLDAIVAAQACYYGQHNAHFVAWLHYRLGLSPPYIGVDF